MVTVTDFELVYAQMSKAVENYGFVVHPRCDVQDPNTGEFDGLNIWVEADQPTEQALYVLLHLFGHSVQWNIDAELRELGLDASLNKTEEDLARVYKYERQASEMALWLLRESGFTHLDQWVSNWFQADWLWLKHLYTTGEKVGYLEYWSDDATLLSPCPAPEFTPKLYVARNSF